MMWTKHTKLTTEGICKRHEELTQYKQENGSFVSYEPIILDVENHDEHEKHTNIHTHNIGKDNRRKTYEDLPKKSKM